MKLRYTSPREKLAVWVAKRNECNAHIRFIRSQILKRAKARKLSKEHPGLAEHMRVTR